jgi:hypothetical protein
LAYWHDGLPVIQMAATGLALMSISFCSSCRNPAVISTCWALWLSRPGQVLIGDKNYYGAAFAAAEAAAGIRLLCPARKGEPEPAGIRFFKPLRHGGHPAPRTGPPGSWVPDRASLPSQAAWRWSPEGPRFVSI